MKIFSFLTTILLSVASFAQLQLNPAPSSGQIALTQANTYIYISNTSASSQTVSLNLVGSGISISSNRCSTIRANGSCYLVVSVPNYSTNSSALSVQLRNGTTTLATLTVAPVVAPASSVFSVSSLQMDGFSNYSFLVQNKTTTAKSYAPVISGTDASKYSIALNRCSNIAPNGTCLVYIKLAPQEAGSYSASITEPQVTGSIALSSTISSSTPGVILPPNPSITMTPASQDFGTITNLGKTATKTFTISNNGNVAVSPIISVAGAGLEISLNRCLVLLSPNQNCTVSVLFNAVSSMTNGVQSGLEISAQATSSTTLLTSTLSATLNVNPVLLGSSGGSVGTPLATPLLINTYSGAMYHYSTVNNKLYAWGANFYGQIGDGTTASTGDPFSVLDSAPLAGKSLKDFGMFDDHACLLTTSNDIYCWGYNYAGQANPDIANMNPVLVPTLMPKGDIGTKTIKKISVNNYSNLALTEDGHVYFWGANGSKQSGSIDSTNPSPSDLAYCGNPYGSVDCQTIVIPKEIDMSGALAGKTIKDIYAGYSNGCVMTTSNEVFCWGANYSGLVGDGTGVDTHVPVSIDMTGVLAGKTIKKMSIGDYGGSTSCVIASDDKPYCWGNNDGGQLGDGTNTNSIVPVATDHSGLLATKTVSEIAFHGGSVCVIANDNKVYCVGQNYYGQLGNGNANAGTSSTSFVLANTIP